jgi:hypothetical protein
MCKKNTYLASYIQLSFFFIILTISSYRFEAQLHTPRLHRRSFLAFLPGEPCAIPAILTAALCSLFATAYLVRRQLPVREIIAVIFALTYYFSLFSLSSRVKSHAVISTTASSTKSISLKTMQFSKKMMTNELIIFLA